MAKRKRWERYSLESLAEGQTDPKGRLLLSELGQINLQDLHLLHVGVDTVRQLYKGTPKGWPVEVVQTAYDAGFKKMVDLANRKWLVGSGGRSGYRWRLQNSDLGLILLFGSRFAELDKEGAHLKIEVSPHFIDRLGADGVQQELDRIAQELLDYLTPTGVAVHTAVDVQGWEPPQDFEHRFVSRSKRKTRIDGVESADFSLAEVAAIYGDRETFMYGSASALQFSLYRKDKEAKKSDKWHFWKSVWDRERDSDLNPVHDPAKPVWRIEARFHHTVIEEFARGIGQALRTFKAVANHLQGLWDYALNSYRLDASRTYLDPFWQILLEDVIWSEPCPNLTYRRVKKTPGEGNERNVQIALGNLLSIYVRNGFSNKQAIHYLQQSGIWNDLLNLSMKKELSPSMLREWLCKQLDIRRLAGKAA